jgi:hypothetical protein
MNKIIIEDYSWNENDSEFEVAFYHSGYTGEAVVLEEKFKVKDFETFLSQQGYLDLKYYAVLEEGDEKINFTVYDFLRDELLTQEYLYISEILTEFLTYKTKLC